MRSDPAPSSGPPSSGSPSSGPSSSGRPSPRFRFFVFTCRNPRSDFRLPLVDALRDHHETWYIWLRRRPLVSGPGRYDQPTEMSLPDLLRFIRGLRRDETINVYFNSTNTYFPGMTILLRSIAASGLWCFDMHDDLRYHNTGFKRWREGRIVALLCRLSHVIVHAAPTLQELFPRSRHLGNASNIQKLPRDAAQPNAVLIIASFDERFDFGFLSALADKCPDIQFHMHGWTRPGDTPTMVKIKAIAAKHANVEYRGAYVMDDLPGILRAYDISVAPYRVDTPITRYIDPLRYYHCLNAGLEVVSTAIPQAQYMQDWIHVVADVATCAETLAAIRSGRSAKQPAYTPITWEQRADRLLHILRTSPRAIHLGAGSVPQQPVSWAHSQTTSDSG